MDIAFCQVNIFFCQWSIQQISQMLGFYCCHMMVDIKFHWQTLYLLLNIGIGYLGDKESTSEILDSEGWLRTGDVCLIDKDGFLFVVDRLKEIIKYKGYQVVPTIISKLLVTTWGSGMDRRPLMLTLPLSNAGCSCRTGGPASNAPRYRRSHSCWVSMHHNM